MLSLAKFALRPNFSTHNITIRSLFQSRKLLYQATSNDLNKNQFLQSAQNKSVYCGYDPTSDSLHLGNLVSIIMMSRLSLLGLKPIFLVGGATGLIGDPSGKVHERPLLDESLVQSNIESLKTEISSVYSNIQSQLTKNKEQYQISNEALALSLQTKWKMINNYQFYKNMNAIKFLRDVGKHFRMGPLMSKEAVSQRLQSEEGISYAEFSYSIIQAYDFLQLYKEQQCILQFGGSDQWGNITNGCDLVRKTTGKEVYGITMPLLLTKSGHKFGKSQGNALYLNPSKTSTEAIFNYFLNSSDEDLEKYLKIFTFYSDGRIQQILKEHNQKRQQKKAQTILAESVLKLIRSEEANISKKREFFTLSHEELMNKNKQFFEDLFSQMQKNNNQYYAITQTEIQTYQTCVDLLVNKKMTKSKSELRRETEKGGIYINNKRLDSSELNEPLSTFLDKNRLFNQYMLVRWGKKRYQFVHFAK